LAVVVTVAKGYNLRYIWKTQGQASAGRTPGGYDINAAQAGEPPGRWGPRERKHSASHPAWSLNASPMTPSTAARSADRDKLGRPRGRYATFADHLVTVSFSKSISVLHASIRETRAGRGWLATTGRWPKPSLIALATDLVTTVRHAEVRIHS
jgi:hypothetical protein